MKKSTIIRLAILLIIVIAAVLLGSYLGKAAMNAI